MRLIDPYSVSGTAAGGALYGICILTAIALLTWLKGRFFCTNICPVGAVLGLMSRFSLNKININPDACVACGLCAQKCPSGCIDFKNKTVDNETCIKCFKCLSLCHNHGIFYGSTPKHRNSQPFNPGRRRFIAGTAAMVLFATAFKGGLNLSKGIARKVKNIIVPPGAVSADKLAEKCLNCNLCVTNCPMKIIKKADNEFPAVHIKYQKVFAITIAINARKSALPAQSEAYLSPKNKKRKSGWLPSMKIPVFNADCALWNVPVRQSPNRRGSFRK